MKKKNKDKIWIVTKGNYSSYRIMGVFSSRAKAKEYQSKLGATEWDGYGGRIETWPIDELCPLVLKDCYSWAIYLDTGELYMPGTGTHKELVEESKKFEVNFFIGANRLAARADSYIDEDHAKKLAIEAYQAYLREGKKVKGWAE